MKLLLVGDACAPTGFGRVNTHLANAFKRAGWDVSWLGINATGDAHPLQKDFDIYPAGLMAGDPLGIERIRGCVEHVKPDVVFMNGDAWTIGAYLDQLVDLTPRPVLIGYCPPDSPNQPYGVRMNALDVLLCPTAFGIRELRMGGYTGKAHVVPYGVDRTLYRPHDMAASREAWGFPPDVTIFGRADRNAKRKRYDETLRIFKRYRDEVDDTAYLHLHCAPKDVGWDLPQLVEYFGLKSHVFFTAQDLTPAALIEESRLPSLFSCWTAHWSCTMGEGFGLVALDSAACGVPQVLPDWSAYGEWMKDGARLVAVSRPLATDGGINSMGVLVDEDDCLVALSDVVTEREVWSRRALDVATRPCYDWAAVTATILGLTEGALRQEETR